MEFNIKCAKCMSSNVEPKGKLWHCKDCGADSDQAAVQQLDLGNRNNGSKPAPQKGK